MVVTMVFISVVAGLLSSMNVWAANFKDVRFHLNDVYMAFLMAGWMLLFSYISSSHNSYIMMVIAIIMIGASFYAIRNQTFIDDKQFLKGMIPHHSMAILMSEKIRDKTTNPKIKKMASNIIQTQSSEINMLNDILHEI